MIFWYCHVVGGNKNYNFHGYLCENDIEYYKSQGCRVIRIL